MRRELNGARLREEILRRGLSQERFSQISGVSPNTLSAAIRGGPVNNATFAKIIVALDQIPALSAELSDKLLSAAV